MAIATQRLHERAPSTATSAVCLVTLLFTSSACTTTRAAMQPLPEAAPSGHAAPEVQQPSAHCPLPAAPAEALHAPVIETSHLLGALAGGGLGLVGGAALGAIYGFSRGNDPPPPLNSDGAPYSFSAGFKATVGGILGGAIGLGVGLLVGGLIGYDEVVVPAW